MIGGANVEKLDTGRQRKAEKAHQRGCEAWGNCSEVENINNWDFDKAQGDGAEDYTKTIELDPKNALVYMNRDNAESKIGKHIEALEDFKRAFELFDDDMYKKYVTGLICREEDKKEEARKYLEEALAIAKKKKNIWMIKEIEETLKDLQLQL